MSVVVGVVSPGAMGSAIGRVLCENGAQVVATLAGRSTRTSALARGAGLDLLPSLRDVVDAADVVLSVAPPAAAESIARGVRSAGQTLLVDMNAVSPETVRRIAPDVDASISGGPPQEGRTTRIYASGPHAKVFSDLPWDERVDVRVLGDGIGLASAVKMCTASMYKGTAALLTHALVTANAYGVLDPVLEDLGDRANNAARRIANAASKSDRYVGEMREIAETQESAGLTSALFEAMAEAYEQIARTPLASRYPEEIESGAPLQDVLDGLR